MKIIQIIIFYNKNGKTFKIRTHIKINKMNLNGNEP